MENSAEVVEVENNFKRLAWYLRELSRHPLGQVALMAESADMDQNSRAAVWSALIAFSKHISAANRG